MTTRIAASLALIVFAMCLIEGVRAENSFVTVVSRGLLGMGVTFVVGQIIGVMAGKMLKEHLAQTENAEKSSNAS